MVIHCKMQFQFPYQRIYFYKNRLLYGYVGVYGDVSTAILRDQLAK